MKCARCGHDSDMHWHHEKPALTTTACRDCLPRNLYPIKTGAMRGTEIDGGMCTCTTDHIENYQA